jgi:hypothetical protein
MVQSAASQRLTLNAAKTKILTPKQVSEYFWLDTNEAIDKLEVLIKRSKKRSVFREDVKHIWEDVASKSRDGHWDKVVKRLYRLAALVGSNHITYKDNQFFLREAPQLSERIFEYILARARFKEYIRLFEWFLKSGNSLYEDVEAQWFESLLLTSPTPRVRTELRKLAVEFIRGSRRGARRLGPTVPAALLLYWIWDGRQGCVLNTILTSPHVVDGPTRRTMASILCARKPAQAEKWLLLAARQPSSEVSALVQLITEIRDGQPLVLPKPLVFVKRPPVFDRFVYDARAWLRLELLSLSPRKDVRTAIKRTLAEAKRNPLRPTEKIILSRLEKRTRR